MLGKTINNLSAFKPGYLKTKTSTKIEKQQIRSYNKR